MTQQRGDVWWADLDVPRGSAPGYRRPLVVVSADPFNRSRIATVVCVVVTTNLRLAAAPGNVLLPVGSGGLLQDSVANVSQIVTIDRSDLEQHIGRLEASAMRLIDTGLRRVLELR